MKEITTKTPTIFDVAQAAGVSRGTVDRVVFGRGRVSQITRDKVHSAIAALNYTPNSNASKLASKKKYTFACLIPQSSPGEYWAEMNQGFLSAAREFTPYNLTLHMHYYNQVNIESFIAESQKILLSKPSGVIMNAVFREEVTQFCHLLEKAGIPYAFVDNKIDDLNYTLYYGIDPYRSGAFGAYLLTSRTQPKEIALVRLLRDPSHKADPNRPRRHGFTDYIEDYFHGCVIHTVFIDPDDPASTLSTLESFFEAHPDVMHIAMTNSRIFLMREYLCKHPRPGRIVVGFDDLENNLACLRDGLIDSLVTRHIPLQAHHALTSFAECVIRNTPPPVRDNYVHMDILTRMNMDHY